MNSLTLTADQHRDVRDCVRKLRRRLGELHQGFQQDSVRSALEALYVRSADTQQIEFDSLTGDAIAVGEHGRTIHPEFQHKS